MKHPLARCLITCLLSAWAILAAATNETAEALDNALQGEHRSAANKARDQYRHPRETLAFFDVQACHTVVELWPGGGWYTDILAPMLQDCGKFIAAGFHPTLPPKYRGNIQRKFEARLAANPAVFGQVQHTTFYPPDIINIAPENSVDRVLTFRSTHNWFMDGDVFAVYQTAFRVLKPGGVFGVVQHRARAGAAFEEYRGKGYLPEAYVIAMAEKAGFKLLAKSDINANPKDTKDHPRGVWTLPPSYRLGEVDRARYTAIGESDRMTLKFIKPDVQ